ncbi:RAD55 family ATPase [Archaeoglobus sp.]
MKIPTGIEFLDARIGGIYAGTFNVLLEEVGAGGYEFLMTVIQNNLEKGGKVFYASLTKTDEMFRREFELVFPKRNVGGIFDKISFRSFAKTYFMRSIVPLHWFEEKATILSLKGEKNVLEELIEFFDSVESESICVVDSLTDLVRITRSRLSWNDLVDFLMGLKVLIQRRNLVVYTILTKDIVDQKQQEDILSIADGIIVFRWKEKGDKMVRTMFVRKLIGVLPLLEKEGIIAYETRIDPERGFMISSVMRVI